MRIPQRIHCDLPGDARWIITKQCGQLIVYLANDIPADSPLEQQFVRQAIRAWRRRHSGLLVILPAAGTGAAWAVRKLRQPAVAVTATAVTVAAAAATALTVQDNEATRHERPPAVVAPANPPGSTPPPNRPGDKPPLPPPGPPPEVGDPTPTPAPTQPVDPPAHGKPTHSRPTHPAHPSHPAHPGHSSHPAHPGHPRPVKPTHPTHPVHPTHSVPPAGRAKPPHAAPPGRGRHLIDIRVGNLLRIYL